MYTVTKNFRVCDMLSNVASEHFWSCRLFGTFHRCVLYPNVFHNASSYLAGQEVVCHSWNKCISWRQRGLPQPQGSWSPGQRPEPLLTMDIRKGVDYFLWYIAWCCLNALLVLKLFWQIGQSMTMSTCVSQCLRMSFFAGMVFPHVEQLQLPSPKFWLIIESSMRLSSKYKQRHF